jgi:hypothetical protein
MRIYKITFIFKIQRVLHFRQSRFQKRFILQIEVRRQFHAPVF